jgi:hypothetical protein
VKREEKTFSEKRQRTVVFINKTKGSTKKKEKPKKFLSLLIVTFQGFMLLMVTMVLTKHKRIETKTSSKIVRSFFHKNTKTSKK